MRVYRRRIAAVLLVTVGAIHLVLAPGYLDEHEYVGILFILTGLGAGIFAPRLWFRGGRFAWSVGGLITASTFLGFVFSRTSFRRGFPLRARILRQATATLIVRSGFVEGFPKRKTNARAPAGRSESVVTPGAAFETPALTAKYAAGQVTVKVLIESDGSDALW